MQSSPGLLFSWMQGPANFLQGKPSPPAPTGSLTKQEGLAGHGPSGPQHFDRKVICPNPDKKSENHHHDSEGPGATGFPAKLLPLTLLGKGFLAVLAAEMNPEPLG
jgi:hypothetical protein